jgi:hypothetical protein
MDERLASGFLRGEPGADTRICMERNMGLKLGGKVVVTTAAAEKAPQAKAEGSQFAHGSP